MSEYNEALSRLEAPERPVTERYLRRIPFGPRPDYISNRNYNRVLKESRFSKLPKYSISQRFYLTWQDFGQYVYNFDLDKSFVNANGDRKSIAIRNIHFDSIFESGSFYLKELNLTLDAAGGIILASAGDFYQFEHTYVEATIGKSFNRGKVKNLDDLMTSITSCLRDLLHEYFFKGLPRNIRSAIRINAEYTDRKIKITFNNCRVEYDGDNPVPLILGIELNESDAMCRYIFGEDYAKNKPYSIMFSNTAAGATFEIDFPNFFLQPIPVSVCSTINPYSCQNIIGSLRETHDMLNKIYPYDNQTNFALWFNDAEGERVRNEHITGYIDLELIIDNTNNLNLDV